MSETKWTPGPWLVHSFGDFDTFEIHGPETDKTDGCCAIADLGAYTEGPKETREANARLIAKAPEMAKVLRACVEANEPIDSVTSRSDSWWIAKARALLAEIGY